MIETLTKERDDLKSRLEDAVAAERKASFRANNLDDRLQSSENDTQQLRALVELKSPDVRSLMLQIEVLQLEINSSNIRFAELNRRFQEAARLANARQADEENDRENMRVEVNFERELTDATNLKLEAIGKEMDRLRLEKDRLAAFITEWNKKLDGMTKLELNEQRNALRPSHIRFKTLNKVVILRTVDRDPGDDDEARLRRLIRYGAFAQRLSVYGGGDEVTRPIREDDIVDEGERPSFVLIKDADLSLCKRRMEVDQIQSTLLKTPLSLSLQMKSMKLNATELSRKQRLVALSTRVSTSSKMHSRNTQKQLLFDVGLEFTHSKTEELHFYVRGVSLTELTDGRRLAYVIHMANVSAFDREYVNFGVLLKDHIHPRGQLRVTVMKTGTEKIVKKTRALNYEILSPGGKAEEVSSSGAETLTLPEHYDEELLVRLEEEVDLYVRYVNGQCYRLDTIVVYQ